MRPNYANVMATVAVFVSLGGASYAAVALPRDSVGTAQLRADSVTYNKLHARSVGPDQLRDDAVDATKLAQGSVKKRSLSPWLREQLARTGGQGQPGAAGETGPRGPGAVAVSYAQAAGDTPNPISVLDVGGISFRASCDNNAGTVGLDFSVRSQAEASLQETITVDSGIDLGNPGSAFQGNLSIDLPAGQTLDTGGPSTATGYTRVAVQAVYSAPGSTLYLHMFALVNADAGKCSIDGVAIPAA